MNQLAKKLIKEYPFEIVIKEKPSIDELMKNKFNGNLLITFDVAKETLESFDDIRMMLSDIATKVLSGEMPTSQTNAGVNAIDKIIISIKVEGDGRPTHQKN